MRQHSFDNTMVPRATPTGSRSVSRAITRESGGSPPKLKRLHLRITERHYRRALEAARRAGFKNLHSYIKVMLWRLTNDCDPHSTIHQEDPDVHFVPD